MQSTIQDCVQDQKEKQLGQISLRQLGRNCEGCPQRERQRDTDQKRHRCGQVDGSVAKCLPQHEDLSVDPQHIWKGQVRWQTPVAQHEGGGGAKESETCVSQGSVHSKLWGYPVSKCKMESNRVRQATWTAVLTHTHLSKHSIYTHPYTKLTNFKRNHYCSATV